jgi:NhaA family Na+:H+ antiporter
MSSNNLLGNVMPFEALGRLIRHEAAGGFVLVGAAVFALILANSALAGLYNSFLNVPASIQVGMLKLSKPLLLWINDGLMAIFFLLIGLEIKRELLEGELSSIRRAALPAIAATGGMVVPALIYVLLNAGDPYALRGWGIPVATDIAFSLGVLALLGSRVPASVKVFLLAIAIADDVGAILIIAAAYTDHLSLLPLGLAGVCLVGLVMLNMLGVTRLADYLLLGLILWLCVLQSGVHATLAGVALGLVIPLRTTDNHGQPPLRHLEHTLHPWVTFGIMPLFAFANAGVSLEGFTLDSMVQPLPLGIALGLFLGKQFGVVGFAWAGVRLGLAHLPKETDWLSLYGVACLTGIGFTMSLFIGTLAFLDSQSAMEVRMGVLIGSLLSALLGYAVLRFAMARTAS